MYYECIGCGEVFDPLERLYTCPNCNSLLEIELDLEDVKDNLNFKSLRSEPPTNWKYIKFLPIMDKSKIVTLNEGGTPLYSCDRLAEEIGIDEVYVKHEGNNPTGSFKDRGMTVGVTKAREFNVDIVACASTGNTSASLAAYAAKVGLKCIVLLPEGKVALGKLSQAIMHGAQVIGVEGNFDRALDLIRKLCTDREDIYLLNSVNPFRPQGQKTMAFEIADQLGFNSPDRIVIPMGNCANIWAAYKGFFEFKEVGVTDSIPKMTGIQADGSMPIVNAVKKGLDEFQPEEDPETIATAISIGNPVNGPKALKAIRNSEGTAEGVSDDEIIQAQKMLARLEGIGVEPASASSVAGLKKLVDQGVILEDERVVCVTTGHILKDPKEVIDVSERPLKVPAEYSEIIKIIE